MLKVLYKVIGQMFGKKVHKIIGRVSWQEIIKEKIKLLKVNLRI